MTKSTMVFDAGSAGLEEEFNPFAQADGWREPEPEPHNPYAQADGWREPDEPVSSTVVSFKR
jgi:hypothetical protein